MSTTALKEVATGSVATKAQPKDFPAMLTAWLPEIQRALPKHMSGDRMSRIALTAFRRNPKLGNCDPRSVFAAVIQSSQLGLEIDTLGRAYLVPYDKRGKVNGKWQTIATECQLIPGWKGLVDLMNRSGQGAVWTGAAFIGDEFEWQLGDSPFVHHKPRGEDDPTKLTHVYSIGRIKGSDWPIIEVWPIEKVTKHRNRYNKVGDSHYSYTNWEMYARKIPLLQVLKYMPCSTELSAAISLNDAAEQGAQNLNIKDAVEGSWTYAHEITGELAGDNDEHEIDTKTGEIIGNTQNGDDDPTLGIKGAGDLSHVGGDDKNNGAPKVVYEDLLTRIQNPTSKEKLQQDATLIGAVDGDDRRNTLNIAFRKSMEFYDGAKSKK